MSVNNRGTTDIIQEFLFMITWLCFAPFPPLSSLLPDYTGPLHITYHNCAAGIYCMFSRWNLTQHALLQEDTMMSVVEERRGNIKAVIEVVGARLGVVNPNEEANDQRSQQGGHTLRRRLRRPHLRRHHHVTRNDENHQSASIRRRGSINIVIADHRPNPKKTMMQQLK